MPRKRVLLLGALVLLALVLPSAVGFYADWLWFGETGYRDVFVTRLTAQGTVGGAAMVLAFAILLANVSLAARALSPRELVLMTREGPVGFRLDPHRLQPLVTLVALVVSVFFGLYAANHWQDWLFFRHAEPFGSRDPILDYDVGFFVFRLPFLEALRGYLLGLTVLSTLAAGAVYVAAGAVDIDLNRGVRIAPAAKRHLAVLAAALFLMLAFGAYLAVPQLLTSTAGIIHGVTNVDAVVRIPALRVLMGVALVGALLALFQMSRRSWWPIVTAVALYAIASAGGFTAAAALHRFIVAPNEQVRETPYIDHNIKATRAAFGLDNVEERELSGDALLTRADLDANQDTLGNVRLWDHQLLLQTFAQIQEIRTYYDFVSVHNDRYAIDGRYRQIMLSARELNSQSLPNLNWINERLTFTHGYGVTIGPVNEVTPEGLPVLFVKDIPPQSSVNLQIDEPSIYYGQLSNDHVFVKTRAREFHYPKGDDNVYTSYEGSGGVPISSFARRLLFSVRFGSLKLLLSNDITRESRVMFHRRLSERVSRIAPFLRYDQDPYLLISDRRLFWLQDAYTVTGRYPYSTPASDGINYIRNSVKATVDAYHGTVAFYLIDETDPIALALQRIFPTLFRPLAEMPEDMRTRLRYPEGIFSLQAAMYATYHMTNPAVFYNKEDLWEIPALDAQPRPQLMQPYYTIMKLPGEQAPEFIQMLPFTPARKDNLASWMVSRSDGDHYGRMVVFQFPKQKVVFGPRQIVARINQDQTIAPQITLWNQQGSEVIQGTLLVIPIEESLIYVRPLYLRSAGGRIPELKRVIVAYQNQIVMEETLDRALNRLFEPAAGQTAPQPAPVDTYDASTTAPSGGEDLSKHALERYERALQAQRSGNWALYGEEIKRLGEVLQQMADGPARPASNQNQ
jgi:uncharacterized membrane protein (UPF0182 family)